MATELQPVIANPPELDPGAEISASNEFETTTTHGEVVVAGTTVEYTIESPPEDHIVYEGLAIIAPGFGGFKRTSRPLRHEMALAGVVSVSYSPVRRDDHSLWSRLARSQQAHADTITAVASDIADQDFSDTDVPPVDVTRRVLLPHSMGGLATAQHASDTPHGTTEAIINLAAAGFGSPTIPELLETIPKNLHHAVFKELIPFVMSGKVDVTPQNFWRFLHYYGVNPTRTIGEIYACLSTDVRPTVWQLGRQGVLSAFLAFEHDALIPPHDNLGDTVDYYEVMPGAGHMAPQLKAKEVAQGVVDTMEVLDIAA